MATSDRVKTLRSLIRLLVDASEVVIKGWDAEDRKTHDDPNANAGVPSRELYEARRVMLGACGMCIDVVDDPPNRLLEIGQAATLSSALTTAVEAGIPDILDATDACEGVSTAALSQQTGINERKLARILRVLSTGHIVTEVSSDHFANTHVGAYLAGNRPAQCRQRFFATDEYIKTMAQQPSVLRDPAGTHSTSVYQTAFQKAMKTELAFFEYFERPIQLPDGTLVDNPIRENFAMFMVEYNQACSPGIIADFPWESLGAVTVVDVGGGVGSMCLDLARAFPQLKFVIEDLPATTAHANAVWNAEMPNAIGSGRVQFIEHDFFTEQPVRGADVYFLRYTLHDWEDDMCVALLARLRNAMEPTSRILIADVIMDPPTGSTFLKSAPVPLPANYGRAHLGSDLQDLMMLALFNGAERTPGQLAWIATRAGLKVVKIWECRGTVSITELCWSY